MSDHPTRTRAVAVVAGLLVAGAVACGGDETAGDETAMDETAMDEAGARSAAPDTTPAAVWSHLQETDYRNSWQMWPDKGELYEGGEPHGMLLTTYLSPSAHEALTGPDTVLPPGAVVVKENYTPDSTLAAVTVMLKSEGYDPGHADWFWAKFNPDGSVASDGMAAGRVNGCIQCHGGAADNDYIMTGPVGGS